MFLKTTIDLIELMTTSPSKDPVTVSLVSLAPTADTRKSVGVIVMEAKGYARLYIGRDQYS